MMKKTYLGIIENEHCDLKTFVLAEDTASARDRVLAHFSQGLGRTYRAEELRIIPFGQPA
jgi:hypothetical protein